MATITLIRGDSYGIRRPLFTYTLYDVDGEPFNLTGCTVRTTYKVIKLAALDDPNDESAVVKHTLIIDNTGMAIMQNGLFLASNPLNGVVIERFTSAETLALPLIVSLINDVELTDASGEIFTFPQTDTITAIDGVTNRTLT